MELESPLRLVKLTKNLLEIMDPLNANYKKRKTAYIDDQLLAQTNLEEQLW